MSHRLWLCLHCGEVQVCVSCWFCVLLLCGFVQGGASKIIRCSHRYPCVTHRRVHMVGHQRQLKKNWGWHGDMPSDHHCNTDSKHTTTCDSQKCSFLHHNVWMCATLYFIMCLIGVYINRRQCALRIRPLWCCENIQVISISNQLGGGKKSAKSFLRLSAPGKCLTVAVPGWCLHPSEMSFLQWK